MRHSRNDSARTRERSPSWRRGRLALSLSLLPLAACLCGPADPALEGPDAPVASVIVVIEGLVTDALTGLPIAGADIDIPAAGDRGKVKTNDDGFYSVRFEGYGTFNVFISKEGYAKARHTASATFGGSPQASFIINVVQNATMYPTIGSVRGVIAGNGPLDAIGGARVLVRLGTTSIFDQGLPLETTTSEDGRFELTGLPAGLTSMRLLIPGQDLDEDGEPDFATKLVFLPSLDEAPEVLNLTVDPFSADGVVWTSFDNVESFAVGPDVSFEFVFAAPMSTTPGATTVSLRRDGALVSTTHAWDDDGLVLTVAPRVPLSVGESYELRVEATSIVNEDVSWGPYAFAVGGDRVPGEVTGVVLGSDPATMEFYNPWIEVAFDPVEDASGYRLYARNDRNQTDWLQVTQGFAASLDPVAPRLGFSLPDPFDSAPGSQTPFGFGETIQVAVVALIGDNEGPFPATPLEVRDQACVDLSVSTFGSFDNSEGDDPIEVGFVIASADEEWLDETATPSVTFANYAFPGGDGFTFASSDFTATWREDHDVELRAQLPAGMSAYLDSYTLDLSALRDPSGNGPCEGEATVTGLIGATSYYERVFDMEAADGWSGDGQWERGAPSAVGPEEAYEGDAVWGTVLDGPYTDDAATTSTLSSPTMRLPVSSGAVGFRYFLDGDDELEVYWVEDGGGETLLDTGSLTYGSWYQSTSSLIGHADEVGHFELRFVTNGDGASVTPGAGAYVDAFEVGGYWSYVD